MLIARERSKSKLSSSARSRILKGKRMITVVVSYPLLAKWLAASPCSIGIHLRLFVVRDDPKPSRR
jgi:hypothetical protein